MAKQKPELTGKQKLFALSYVGKAKFNATEAARLAGYDGDYDSISSIGHANLKKVEIKSLIKDLTTKKLIDEGYQDNRVIKELLDTAFADMTDFQNESGAIFIDADTQPTAAIKKLKYGMQDGELFIKEFELHDKKWALEMLSKLLDMKSGEEVHNHKLTFSDFIRSESEDK